MVRARKGMQGGAVVSRQKGSGEVAKGQAQIIEQWA